MSIQSIIKGNLSESLRDEKQRRHREKTLHQGRPEIYTMSCGQDTSASSLVASGWHNSRLKSLLFVNHSSRLECGGLRTRAGSGRRWANTCQWMVAHPSTPSSAPRSIRNLTQESILHYKTSGRRRHTREHITLRDCQPRAYSVI